jgi:hypothetical protein
VKLADFGLAKIIGEESFTTTLCGTPSCKLVTSQAWIIANVVQMLHPRFSRTQTTAATPGPLMSGL